MVARQGGKGSIRTLGGLVVLPVSECDQEGGIGLGDPEWGSTLASRRFERVLKKRHVRMERVHVG